MEDPRQPLLNYRGNSQGGYGIDPNTPYQQTYGQGYQQQEYADYGNAQTPGHVQYHYGPPPPPVYETPLPHQYEPPPPQHPLPQQYGPPQSHQDPPFHTQDLCTPSYYPSPDPGPALAIPVPKMTVNTHFSMSLCLCVMWSLLLIWPAVIFSAIALGFSYYSKKQLKKNLHDKAQSTGRTACLCSVVSLAAASLYCVCLFGTSVVVYALYLNATTNATNAYFDSVSHFNGSFVIN